MPDAITDAKNALKFAPPKFYTDYAPARTANSEELVRGLKYMKCLVSSVYNIPTERVRINESTAVINERINLECARELSKAGKKQAKLSAKAQGTATQVLGGTELINPFSLDNLAVEPQSKPAVKPSEKGEE